jgi:hypothetical protein
MLQALHFSLAVFHFDHFFVKAKNEALKHPRRAPIESSTQTLFNDSFWLPPSV